MKTVVFQSYRTTRVAGWTKTCMDSAKSWADSRGFDYRFFDDSFFELAPGWFRERCAGQICPLTDLARLVAARDFLAAGYERTVWVDADMLIFAPQSLGVEVSDGFAFCVETWTSLDAQGQPQFAQRVNNSISIFTRDNRQIDFLIDACLRIGRSKTRLDKLDAGTRLLTGLATVIPMPVLPNVGMLSPLLLRDIASGEDRFVPAYALQLRQPLAAANLCGSLVDQPLQGIAADETVYDAVVSRLLQSRGDVINRHCAAS
jgi:hypothetical protein